MDKQAKANTAPRTCTCHPDDNPPVPCPRKFALTECRAASRDSARDRLLLSISEALIRLLDGTPYGDPRVHQQIIHNLTGCNKDLLVASDIGHGRHSEWRDQINAQ